MPHRLYKRVSDKYGIYDRTGNIYLHSFAVFSRMVLVENGFAWIILCFHFCRWQFDAEAHWQLHTMWEKKDMCGQGRMLRYFLDHGRVRRKSRDYVLELWCKYDRFILRAMAWDDLLNSNTRKNGQSLKNSSRAKYSIFMNYVRTVVRYR